MNTDYLTEYLTLEADKYKEEVQSNVVFKAQLLTCHTKQVIKAIDNFDKIKFLDWLIDIKG